MDDLVPDCGLAEADPDLAHLFDLERRRQDRKLIMIASESICPRPVREALMSEFGNIYAEGYPPLRMCADDERRLRDHAHQLANVRRYSDRRYYKGVELVDLVEAIARRRTAEAFATPEVPADEIFANVQPLSGAAANNAVYNAFVRHGETVMGMSLSAGGHLTHGSPVNRSGRNHEVVSYSVGPDGRLDYEAVRDLARRARPRLIIAGFSAYPWDIDWAAFRSIADDVGAILLADIAHTAGLVAAGVARSPIAHAHVVSFTTHKTLCGPRGAVLLSTHPEIARKLDVGVFPGEQGGPHINQIAAKAVAMSIARTEGFRRIMRRVVRNAAALAEAFRRDGLVLAYGGTDTHMALVDLRGLPHAAGAPLSGEIASRLLDLVGITCNKNTIHGDTNAVHPSGLRFGTTWVSQRGLEPEQMDAIARVVADVLRAARPFAYPGGSTPTRRAKIDLPAMERARRAIRDLVDRAWAPGGTPRASDAGGGDVEPYPYFFVPRPKGASGSAASACGGPGGGEALGAEQPPGMMKDTSGSAASVRGGPGGDEALGAEQPPGMEKPEPRARLEIRGPRAPHLLDGACTADASGLDPGGSAETLVLDPSGEPMAAGKLLRTVPDDHGDPRFEMDLHGRRAGEVAAWLRALSDGYVAADDDLWAKVEGPAVVSELPPRAGAGPEAEVAAATIDGDPRISVSKPFFVGRRALFARGRPAAPPKEEFRWKPTPIEPRGSCLYDEHVRRTRKHLIAPFAGWLMPLWFKGIAQEHEAVRCRAGLFDVSHMGVLDVAGRDAERFLELLTTNHVAWLRPGHAHYSYLLDIDGSVMDDILVYRRGPERFMVVVNAANAERDEAWLRAAATGRFLLDRDDPDIEVPRRVEIRDLKDPSAGADRRVDIAIQGPASLDVLAAAAGPGAFRRRIERLGRFEFAEGEIDGAAALVSRTGYTGEDVGFEIYVHPDAAPPLWNRLLDVGAPHCVEIAGLGARDSTRTEAGLPLHGHELAGPHGVSPIEAGYGSFVHLHKPFFVGRRRMTEQAGGPARQIVRFRLSAQGGKMVRPGNVVVAGPRAEYAGVVTSSTAVQGRQFGMALVASEFAVPGAVVHVYPLSEKDTPPPARALDAMAAGDRVVVPREGQVLTRFPRRDERTGRCEMASTGETTCAR